MRYQMVFNIYKSLL